MREADTRRGPYSLPVRPAMRLHADHRAQPGGIDRLGRGGMEKAGDTAHAGSALPGQSVGEAIDRPQRLDERLDRLRIVSFARHMHRNGHLALA